MPAVMIVMGALLIVVAVISHDVHEANMVALARDVPIPTERTVGQSAFRRNAAFNDAARGAPGGGARAACLGVGISLVVLGVLAAPLSLWWDRRAQGGARGPAGRGRRNFAAVLDQLRFKGVLTDDEYRRMMDKLGPPGAEAPGEHPRG